MLMILFLILWLYIVGKLLIFKIELKIDYVNKYFFSRIYVFKLYIIISIGNVKWIF